MHNHDFLVDYVEPSSLLKEIYSSTYDYGIFTFDLARNVTTWNVGAERITGFTRAEMLGRDNIAIFTPEDTARGELEQEMQIARTTGRAEDYRWHMRKDGSRFWADGVLTAIHDESGEHTGYLKIFRDVTERKLAEVAMHQLANSDALTGLANRYAFEAHAVDLIAMASRSSQPLALHLIDLDRFKQVNDTLGHHAGDLLLQEAARRMRHVLRESDFVARLGGDEFVVLQPGMNSPDAAAELASKLIGVLSQVFEIGGHETQISCCVGIAVCPYDAVDLDLLLKKADLAMYRAKAEGNGRFHYFTEKLDAIAHQKSAQLAALRQAVAAREFSIVYQPKVAFEDGRTVGVEALLRCANPAFSGLPMEQVVNLALDAGLMKDLSFWVLREVCSQLRRWQDQGLTDFRMCVNLCAQDLTDSETPDFIDALLEELDLAPHALEIELTERQALDVERHGLAVLHALRSRGIAIALDDFGTGYSALSSLKNLPVTAVKLDKSFLVGIPRDDQGCAVIKAVMDLSHALGLETVAEGVETDSQAAFLKENNCSALQGFLISRPLSSESMTAWLVKRPGAVH